MMPLDVNPDWVTPGWVPLVLVLLIALVCVGLYLNMRKHVRIAKVNDPAASRLDSDSAMEQSRGE